MNLTLLHERFPYALPITSALALIITLPPFNVWQLILVALVPLYLFIYRETATRRIFIGVLFFGLLFSGYLSYITLFGFNWIPEAHLFSTLVKITAIPLVLLTSIATALAICLLKSEKKGLAPLERVILFGIFAVIEWLITKLFMGFNYGSLAYAASHIPALRFMASIGGTFLVSFMIVFGNAALAEAVLFFHKKQSFLKQLLPLGIFLLLVTVSLTYQHTAQQRISSLANTRETVSIAVIQDTTRTEKAAFGTVTQNSFHFPLLEKRIAEALTLHPDIIIYPFSPWIGTLAATLDNSPFTKEVIGMDPYIFGKWLKKNLPSNVTLATWDTHFSDGKYWNEINFWRNGILIDSYRKVKLFPFMDYTPTWAANVGVYSTPYDATAGTSTAPATINEVVIGNLVCSEVSDPASAVRNGASADVLFAIGSEAMFNNPFPSEFNLLNAQLRAIESGRTVVRANKFGPSAFIDPYGNILNKIPYGESGILFTKIPIHTEHIPTLYNSTTEHILITLLVLYVLFLWFLGFLWSRKVRKPWHLWFLKLRRFTPPTE